MENHQLNVMENNNKINEVKEENIGFKVYTKFTYWNFRFLEKFLTLLFLVLVLKKQSLLNFLKLQLHLHKYSIDFVLVIRFVCGLSYLIVSFVVLYYSHRCVHSITKSTLIIRFLSFWQCIFFGALNAFLVFASKPLSVIKCKLLILILTFIIKQFYSNFYHHWEHFNEARVIRILLFHLIGHLVV